MSASTTMTIRLTPALKEKLGRLAQDTRRTRSFLAAEALETYVNRELQIIEGIQRGLADMAAGRVTPHDEAIAQIDAAIDAAIAAVSKSAA
ncbi:MAG: CopG family ribbon-helix-helix protein [Pseudomonadota bacterium]